MRSHPLGILAEGKVKLHNYIIFYHIYMYIYTGSMMVCHPFVSENHLE